MPGCIDEPSGSLNLAAPASAGAAESRATGARHGQGTTGSARQQKAGEHPQADQIAPGPPPSLPGPADSRPIATPLTQRTGPVTRAPGATAGPMPAAATDHVPTSAAHAAATARANTAARLAARPKPGPQR